MTLNDININTVLTLGGVLISSYLVWKGNKAGGASTTATYNASYADAGTSNACEDTAAGGYNS
jgi:hypothetical protein